MSSLVFHGIEGSNPLGFLAALGAFRLLDLVWPKSGIRLRWVRDGGWRPEALGLPVEGEAELCRILHEQAPWAPLDAFEGLGKNLTVPRRLFAGVVRKTIDGADSGDRRAADFAAAFGCEVLDDQDKDRIRYTDLCFITGSGHQDFLGTARGLEQSVQPGHLREALFGPWRRADAKLSMRWDPEDAKEYALRWRDPSIGGVSSVWGANRLAFEALPLFPVVAADAARTIGFRRRRREHDFTWPIWTEPASLDTVRGLLGLRTFGEDNPNRSDLRAMGVGEIFRAQRVRIGQGANFKVSFRPARAV